MAQPAQAQAAPVEVATLPLPCDSRSEDVSPKGDSVLVNCRDHAMRLLAIPSGKELLSAPAQPGLARLLA